jgi:hypothetical protein
MYIIAYALMRLCIVHYEEATWYYQILNPSQVPNILGRMRHAAYFVLRTWNHLPARRQFYTDVLIPFLCANFIRGFT